MTFQIVNLVQGTPEWAAHRSKHLNASDAPAMLGVSPYKSRAQLVKEYATGVAMEVDEATQRRFDDGHRFEALARPIAEQIIGEDLFPVSGVKTGTRFAASFDGLTMNYDVAFEHKTLNDSLRQAMRDEEEFGTELPEQYRVQMEHQCMVSGAERILFMASKWEGTKLVEERHCWYVPDMALRSRIVAAWQQFDADVAAYQPEPVRVVPVAAPVEGFGALSLRVEGRIIASNLDAFKAGAEQFISRLPKPEDLQTDQDFADAKGAVKACEEAEARIKAAKDSAQAEMTDVDAAFRLADSVAQTIRAARLALDKVVKVEEQARKDAIVANGAKAVRAHYDTINETLGVHRIQPAQSLQLDLGAVIKGKKSLTSMRDAVDTAVAGFKIAGSEQAERVRANVRVLEMEQGTWAALFHDRVNLCATKSQEDLRNLIVMRIQEAKEAEDRRQEEQRRKDEQAQTAAQDSPQVPPYAETTTPALASVPTSPVPARSIGGSATKIKLGDINARLAPITITADGLAKIGIQSAAKQGGATLYRESDFPLICHALSKVLEQAMQKKAA